MTCMYVCIVWFTKVFFYKKKFISPEPSNKTKFWLLLPLHIVKPPPLDPTMSRQVYKGVTLPPGVTLKVPGGAAAAAAAASDTETTTTGTLPLSCRFYAHLPEQAGLFDLEGRQQLDVDEKKTPTFDHLSKYKRVAFHPATTTKGDRCSWVVTVDELQNIIIWNHSKRNIVLRTHPLELEARRHSSIAREELLRRQSGGGGRGRGGGGGGGGGRGGDRDRDVKRRSTSTTSINSTNSTTSTNAAETKMADSSSSFTTTSTVTSISSSDTTSNDEQQQQQQQRPKSPSSHPTISSKQHRAKPPGSIRGVTFWVRPLLLFFFFSLFLFLVISLHVCCFFFFGHLY